MKISFDFLEILNSEISSFSFEELLELINLYRSLLSFFLFDNIFLYLITY